MMKGRKTGGRLLSTPRKVLVALSEEDYEAINRFAADAGLDRSAAVRMAVRLFLREHPRPPEPAVPGPDLTP
jgi:predicted DNA binding CopG/RHH family protein